MPTNHYIRTYSPMAQEAVTLLGLEIAAARKERRWSQTELAERAGVSRSMVQRVEKGSLKSEIGVVFEMASLLKINLFGDQRRQRLASAHEKAPLIPQRIKQSPGTVDDNF